MMSRERVTLRNVAEATGCSIAVASTVLNGARGNTIVSPALRKLVLTTAERLGYRPNYLASSLKLGRSMSIGLLLDPTAQRGSGHGNAWLRSMIEGAELGARAAGYSFVVLGPSGALPVLERGALFGADGRVDALLAPGGKPSLRDFDTQGLRVPLVLFNDDRYGTGLPFVGLDPAPGLRALVAHLAERGHRQLLWIGMDATPECAGREALVRALAQEAGLRVSSMELPAATCTEQHEIIAHLRMAFAARLRPRPEATALVCYNDLAAMGVQQALWENGLRVPQDYSVTGFDDLFGDFAHPALTTISHQLAEIGRRCTQLAIQLLQEDGEPETWRGRSERVPAALAVRHSTGPARYT